MKTAADRLKWAIDFVNKDLKTQRPGDWLNLKDDLGIFLSGGRLVERITLADAGGLVAVPLAGPLPQDYTEEDFQVLQTSFKNTFDNLTATNITGDQMVHVEGTFYVMSFRNANYLYVSGPTRDVALLVLMGLLMKEPTDRVLRCPECNSYFYRVRKQNYCSRTCVNRATVREWRKTDEAKKKESEAAHKRYVKKVKTKHGEKVKVQRRRG